MIAEYLLISLAPAVIGIIAGGSLGYLYAMQIHRLLKSVPSVRRWVAVIPWRAPIFALPLVLLVAPVIPMSTLGLGLGVKSGVAGVGITVLLFAIAFSANVVLQHGSPQPLSIQLWGIARSLLVGSLVLGVFVAQSGGSSMGLPFFFATGAQSVSQAFWSVLSLALAVDLLLGIGGSLLWRRSTME